MSSQLISFPAFTALFTVLASFLIGRHLWLSSAKKPVTLDEKTDLSPQKVTTVPINAIRKLVAAFPSQITVSPDEGSLAQFQSGYWAKQCANIVPACIVTPRSTADVAKILGILKEEHVARQHSGSDHGYFFTLRSGGHSHYASALQDGIIVNMSAFNRVEIAQDGKTVTVGSGARWGSVIKILETQGLVTMSGRDTKVGAGGLTLGGGISFLSPRYGFVASNVISFEVITASGEVITASAKEHPDLWRALKGGSNSFGVVTRMKFPTFPSSKAWGGFIYLPAFEARRTIAALHHWNMRDDSGKPGLQYDEDAAGPIGCFAYMGKMGIHAAGVYMVHTKVKDSQSGWPLIFKASPFRSLWRIWSTVKVQPLSSVLGEISATNPNGRRQIFSTVTVVSDLETLLAAHDIHLEAVQAVRNAKVDKGLIWNYITQPILPQWATKGEPGPMGFSKLDKPLMLLSFAHSWEKQEDDNIINSETRRAVEKIEAMSRARKTDHPYRYLNYSSNWQKPFESYGEENHKFLQDMSRKYDEQGLFQKSCTGGFKLFSEDS